MPVSQRKDNQKYSTTTGIVFLFNLIVGTGALALPGAVQKAGVIIGILLLLILGLFSLVTVTFVVEALAAANALSRKRYDNEAPGNVEREHLIEEQPLVSRRDTDTSNDIFEITEKYEIGQMGVLMTPMWCQIVTYFCLCIYLFGDLSIYAAVVGKTTANILCTFKENSTKIDDQPCWENKSISKVSVYRLSIFTFVLLLGPFVFFNLQKTKSLQILTIIMRWLSFFIMIIWCIYRLSTVGQEGYPPLANFEALPTIFGTLVYSYMCQHSIPGLLHPIVNKQYLTQIIGIDYSAVAVFYISLSMIASFTFKEVHDIFTMNFWEITLKESKFTFQRFLSYTLALFPIFTLSTSFPMIGITFKNNLRSLCVRNHPPVWYYDKLLFPLLALLPPTILALFVSDLYILVGVVGSYAGACVQYLIPCLLVQFARRAVKDIRGTNSHASPFRCNFWIYLVYIWMSISLICITENYSLEISKICKHLFL